MDRIKEVGESILRMVDQEINMSVVIKMWVSGELMFYLPLQ